MGGSTKYSKIINVTDAGMLVLLGSTIFSKIFFYVCEEIVRMVNRFYWRVDIDSKSFLSSFFLILFVSVYINV